MFSSFSIKFLVCSYKILIFIILWFQAPLSSMNWMSAKLILNSILWLSESWTIKKVEHRRIDAFELWCWRTLENPLDCKEIKPVNPKGNQSWIFIGRTDAEAETLATWSEELTHWKRPWCWERFKAGGEVDGRGWDGWMASPTRWTWVWASSGSWWWTGKPGMLQPTGSQRVRHDWATELNCLSVFLSPSPTLHKIFRGE